MRLVIWPMLFILSAAAPGSAPVEKPDQAARIRTAVARGEVLPLSGILTIAQSRVPGEMLEVGLEEAHGRIAYEVKILTPNGRVQEVRLDARTGRVLAVESE